MHPLELQLKDLKAINEDRSKKVLQLNKTLRDIRAQIEGVKEMLHPSRQKHIDAIVSQINSSLGG